MGRVGVLFGLVAGGLVGWLVAPWTAVRAGLASWYAPFLFYLATGPVRWVRWLVAGGWEESRWDNSATGDNGKAAGALQYHLRAPTAAVRPPPSGPDGSDGRRSAFWSAYYAPALTLAHLEEDDLEPWLLAYVYLVLRVPVVGYLAWRQSWRSGRPPESILSTPTTRQAWEGLAVNAGLAVVLGLVCAVPATMLGGTAWRARGRLRRWWRRVR